MKTNQDYNKQFPNGFDNWAETHHEIVKDIEILLETNQDDEDVIPNRLLKTVKNLGQGGLYELGIELTNKFETQNKGVIWGLKREYFDTLEKFLQDEL